MGPITRLAIIAAMALPAILLAAVACRQAEPPVAEWVVEVYQSGSLAGTGSVVGDGSQVLTVLSYNWDMPSGLEVVAGAARYPARIVVFDPRTGATLLELEGASLPGGTPGDARQVKEGQTVIVQGWLSHPDAVVEDGLGNRILPAGPGMARTRAEAYSPYGSPLRFRIGYSSAPYRGLASPLPGAVVTDTSGSILGLVGNMFWGPIPPSLPSGYVPPVVGINSALELLSDDFPQRPEANGPTGYAVLTSNTASAYLEVPENYQDVADAVQILLGKLGEPLAVSELSQTYPRFGSAPTGGRLLLVSYASPVELRNQDGELLAQSSRLAIGWDRPGGEPGVVFYSSTGGQIEGAFALAGSVGVLDQLLFPD